VTTRYYIRHATSQDAPVMADLLNAIIRAGGTTSFQEEFTPERFDVEEITGSHVVCCYVAIDPASDEVVAYQTLGHYPELPNDVADIGTFARIDRKQSGAGSAIFAYTKASAAEAGLSEINATIRADNTGGLAYYTKQGFVDIGVSKAVPLSDGTLVDRIHKRFKMTSAN
jgi:RimJ/RimL family protein N-acetyltransferase